MSKKTPAFPVAIPVGYEYEHHDCDGMTLRDYFAAKAMAVYLSQNSGNPRLPAPYYAEAAYCMADAMLEARK